LTLEKKSKASLTDEQLAIREANRQKAAVYKERRIALGLSQEQLAQKAGIDRSTISYMESGKCSPRWETRQKIRRVLGMPEESEEQVYSIEQLAVWESNRQKAAPYKERRVALGLSQTQLAKKAGIKNSTISLMEMGKIWLRWETRQKIRRALEMPEEGIYSIEERNAFFLELQSQNLIEWIVGKNVSTLKAMGAISYLEDFRQDLSLCAIRAIERFQADRGTSLKTFVASSLTLFAKRWIAKFGMHGMSGKIEYPLPKICVFSLDTLRKSGFEIAG